MCETAIKDLNGLENASRLNAATLVYNRSLADISALAGSTLENLEIEACSRIKDLSVLHQLPALKRLSLSGRNELPDISFVKNMPALNELRLYMRSLDGDMSACDGVAHVNLEDHRHYNRKSEQYRNR